MEDDKVPFRVLFLCTGNSARSVFAEYFLRHLGGKRFEVHSAGASPSGTVNPIALPLGPGAPSESARSFCGRVKTPILPSASSTRRMSFIPSGPRARARKLRRCLVA